MEAIEAPRRRPGGRSARVRAAVLEATLDELAENGYAAMTMQGVADRAGVNKTSLYRRWAGKAGLLAEALLATSADVTDPPATGEMRRDLLVPWVTAPAAPGEEQARTLAVHGALVAA